jgi:hypothetical protein
VTALDDLADRAFAEYQAEGRLLACPHLDDDDWEGGRQTLMQGRLRCDPCVAVTEVVRCDSCGRDLAREDRVWGAEAVWEVFPVALRVCEGCGPGLGFR